MASATTASRPRYAPADPTLPKPWKGLVDGNTGYIYFWNPETNVTQYERPNAPHITSSSFQDVPSSSQQQQNQDTTFKEKQGEEECEADKSGGFVSSGGRDNQTTRNGSDHSNHVKESSASVGNVCSNTYSQVTDSQTSTPPGAIGSNVASASVDAYRSQHEITVSGNNVPPPFMSFESTGFPMEILREVRSAGFTAPTPIQAQSWPIALQNHDIVAIAKTGSGKTLGYLIPSFIHLKRRQNNPKMGPTVLVLSPTRELATQIQDEAEKFGRSARISCTCLYGGAPKGPQLKDLERGVDIVVATPGRLNDILEMGRVSLNQISYLVLDEADRMLDMGFEPQIRKIVKEIPPRRQTLMYTATWPKEVRKIASDLLVNPVQVNIGSIDQLVANKSITQHIEVIAPMEKQRRLEQILRSEEQGSKIIIFCSTKKMCDMLANKLSQFGAAAIHGDKSQGERDYVLNQFRIGRSPVLVATDVAARGLDVKDIRVVVNYDFPTGIEDYVHRIGRTGRAGATGVAYTFFSDQNAKHSSDLIKILEGANQQVPPEIREMVGYGGGMGRGHRQYDSGSGNRDGGRGWQNDSSYSGRGGRGGPPSMGRSERGYGGRGYDHEPHDRYKQSYHDGTDDTGRNRSRSPNRGDGGWGYTPKSWNP